MKLKNGLSSETGWQVTEQSVDLNEFVDSGSRFMVGNGYLGYRGTFCDWGSEQYVACVVTNTWDRAEGEELTELCNVPNPLYAFLVCDGTRLDSLAADPESVRMQRSLDFGKGLFRRSSEFLVEGVLFEEERFALVNPVHGLVARYRITSQRERKFSFHSGIDTNVWSLSGEHFRDHRMFEEGPMLGVQSATQEADINIHIIESLAYEGIDSEVSVEYHSNMLLRKVEFTLRPGQTVIFEKFATIYSSKDTPHPHKAALALNLELKAKGYEQLAEEVQQFWREKWKDFDVQILGHLEDQTIVRFNTYQSFIATPLHEPLPVGARGLSCQVCQGASFWDQEIFNLPMYIYTCPEIARNLLQYRHKTLDGARRKAKSLGYKGAFFAWASGETGDELFPDFFFADLFSGRPFRNYFNTWQIHVSPDVAFAVNKYLKLTGDQEFLVKYGAELLFEIARFVVSRASYRYDLDRTEILRVIGPDEYHENVDNNAFTNWMCSNALRYAIEYYDLLKAQHSSEFQSLESRLELTSAEREVWEEIADSLYVPQPNLETGLIEQFDGYFGLEDVTPDVLRGRLLDPGEYWGFPTGVAVHTQVLKQADVIQLLALYHDFSPEVYAANYKYYEQRTEHGSSLSPAMHAIVACRADAMSEAYRYFRESATIDFYGKSRKRNSGGKFLGGIHTAAAGAVWMIIVEGLAGVRVIDDVLFMSPKIPEQWAGCSFVLNLKGRRFEVRVETAQVTIDLVSSETSGTVEIYGQRKELFPGARGEFLLG